MSDQLTPDLEDLADGAPSRDERSSHASGAVQEEIADGTNRECWMTDDAVLELLATSPEWAAWTTNPTRPPFGTGTPADIFGQEGTLYLQPHASRDDMRNAYLQNHAGGVPLDIVEALLQAAGVVGARARAVARLAANIVVLERDLGKQVSRKPLREAIWFWWNAPRFGHLERVRSKYPLTLRWSPAAWAARADRTSQLVLEHVTPLNIHVDQLIAARGDEQATRAILHSIELVVITKGEDKLVTESKWAQKIPDNGTDGYQRYLASGLKPDTFFIPAYLPTPEPNPVTD